MTKVGMTDCGRDRRHPYEAALRLAGLEPVILDAASAFERGQLRKLGLQGLVLTGGTDVNPRTYGQMPAPETDKPDDPRDAMEFAALSEAIESDLPILAICRGMQVLNVHLGGSLQQHLASTALHRQRFEEDPPGRHRAAHDVAVVPGTKLAQIAGAAHLSVNSRHHQAVDRLGDRLRVSARSGDGSAIVEALEMPGQRFVVAVQWHPEDRTAASTSDLALFTAFARECGAG